MTHYYDILHCKIHLHRYQFSDRLDPMSLVMCLSFLKALPSDILVDGCAMSHLHYFHGGLLSASIVPSILLFL